MKNKKGKKCNEGGIGLKNNDCCECKEGCVFGKSIYCSKDGRFHQLHNKAACENFIKKTGLKKFYARD